MKNLSLREDESGYFGCTQLQATDYYVRTCSQQITTLPVIMYVKKIEDIKYFQR